MPGSNLGQDIVSDDLDFVVLLSPSRKMAVYDLEIGHQNFLSLPFINQIIIRCYIGWAADGVVNYAVKKWLYGKS
jgi:hypothetical protein